VEGWSERSRADRVDSAGNRPEPRREPLLSSEARGWRDFRVDLHHFCGADHVHPMREHIIGVHLAGAVNLQQSRGGRTLVRRVRPGDVTVTPAGEPKRFAHTGDNVVVLLRFAPSFVAAIAGEELGVDADRIEIVECPGAADPRLAELGARMVSVLGHDGDAARIRAEALACAIATHVVRRYASAPVPARVPPTLGRRRLARSLEYIDAHLHEDLRLASIAGELAMSPGHFAHAFRAATGMPPHRYLLARRIEHAQRLLRETSLSITEIAHRVGCASPSHFSVLFHRSTGQTPRDYRSA